MFSIITALLVASTPVSTDPWIDLGTGSMGTSVALNRSSFRVIPDKDGQTFRTVTFRMQKNGTATFARFVIFDRVCAAGEGPVYVLALDTDNVEKHGYVKQGGNVITTIADIVCAVRADRVLQADPKGTKL